MNNTNNIKEPQSQYTKESIIILADEAKKKLNQNKYLLEIIDIFNQQISTVKNLITDYSLNTHQKNISNNNTALLYKNQLSSLNSKLKEEINKTIIKQEAMLNKISKDLLMEKQTLSQNSIDNFILKNTIRKLDSTIKTLTKGIESSKKYDIFREPKRESGIEIKESKNIFLVYNLESQQNMLLSCRSYSHCKYKNLKKEILINKIKKNIANIKNIIRYYSYKLYGDETKGIKLLNTTNEDKKKDNSKKVDIKKRIGTTPNYKKQLEKIDKKKFLETKIISINENNEENDIKNDNNFKEESNENNSDDNTINKTSFLNENDSSLFKNMHNEKVKDKQKEKNKERKKINILNVDELLDIGNIEVEDEEIIDNELNSDDEVFFENKIKQKKKIKTDFLSTLKKDVPSINLSQIEFNKLKVINDADAYSLQKRNFEQGNINGKIRNMKKQIKNLEKKIDMNKKKLNVIHNFIEDVKYNYKLLKPIKVHTSAAGNPVHYIREKLLNIVEETISQSEKKDNKNIYKHKTGNTAVEEGEENDEELEGSDYSDEDEIIDNYQNKDNENNDKNKEKKNKIKTNLITRFELNEKEENKNNNVHNFNDDILGNTIPQSK